MCYDTDGTYDPDTLDGFASDCVASGVAAHPTYYKYGSLLNGFCTDNAGPAGATASTTPGSAVASSSMDGGTTAATTTTAPAAQATNTSPASTKSIQQAQATSSETGVTSSVAKVTSTKAAGTSGSTTSSQSSSTVSGHLFSQHDLLGVGVWVRFTPRYRSCKLDELFADVFLSRLLQAPHPEISR